VPGAHPAPSRKSGTSFFRIAPPRGAESVAKMRQVPEFCRAELFVSERNENRYQPSEERYNRQDGRPDKQSRLSRTLRVLQELKATRRDVEDLPFIMRGLLMGHVHGFQQTAIPGLLDVERNVTFRDSGNQDYDPARVPAVRLIFRLENYRPNYLFACHGPAQCTSGLVVSVSMREAMRRDRMGRRAEVAAAGRMKIIVDIGV
jgi:hypothetical protein